MALPTISLDRAKAHLRVEHDLDDTLIQLFVEAAVERTVLEIGLAGCLGDHVSEVPCSKVVFLYPVSAVTKVEVWAESDWEEVESGDYELTGNFDTGYRLEIGTIGSKFRVTWAAGFGENAPAWFVVAALFLVGHYYENRSSVLPGQGVAAVELPMSFQHLTGPHRWIHFA